MDETSPLPPLTPEQERAIERIMDPELDSAILTGEAGVGKSTIIATAMKRYPDKFTICSTTARSALLVGGVTVDRLFSIDRKNWTIRNPSRCVDNMMGCNEIIVIDEASMVGEQMAHLIEDAIDVAGVRRKVIFSGDWAQARPVKDDWPQGNRLFTTAERIVLRKCHRQDNPALLRALNEVRRGVMSDETIRFFGDRVTGKLNHDDTVVKMFATNKEVNNYNYDRLDSHVAATRMPIAELEAKIVDLRPEFLQKKYPLDVDELLYESPLAHEEDVADGCRVIITFNVVGSDLNGPLWSAVNGDTGYLVEYNRQRDIMTILLDRTGEAIEIPRIRIDVYGFDTRVPDYQMIGFPVRLGYAVTIHKSQGMTLQNVQVDIKSIGKHPQENWHGLAYVALSRCRTVEGLTLLNWNPKFVKSDPTMIDFIEAGAKDWVDDAVV